MGPMHRCSKDSLLAERYTTYGDVNPDRLWAFMPLVSGGLVAGRRHPPCPLLLALHGFTVAGRRSPYQKPFPLSPFTFVPDDEAKYIQPDRKRRIISTSANFVIHRPRASACSV